MTDIFPRSAFIEAEVVNTPGPQNMDVNVSRSAYNINITDFIPFVNVMQSQRAINRQLDVVTNFYKLYCSFLVHAVLILF